VKRGRVTDIARTLGVVVGVTGRLQLLRVRDADPNQGTDSPWKWLESPQLPSILPRFLPSGPARAGVTRGSAVVNEIFADFFSLRLCFPNSALWNIFVV
jgi:hypothetical protein